jgi:WXXGXW repeat (2 copies)
MLRKTLIASALGCLMTFGAMAAEVYVRVAPPRPIHERRLVSPGPGYVWTPGYHRYEGERYVWAPGQWQRPPRPRAHWEAARWVHRPGGWVLVEGHWR